MDNLKQVKEYNLCDIEITGENHRYGFDNIRTPYQEIISTYRTPTRYNYTYKTKTDIIILN